MFAFLSVDVHTAVFGKVYRRYFKERDDDLSSNQGSLCSLKMILIKIIRKQFKVYIYIYFIFVIKLKHNINFIFVNSIDKQTNETAFAATFGQIGTLEYYAAPDLEGSGTLF